MHLFNDLFKDVRSCHLFKMPWKRRDDFFSSFPCWHQTKKTTGKPSTVKHVSLMHFNEAPTKWMTFSHVGGQPGRGVFVTTNWPLGSDSEKINKRLQYFNILLYGGSDKYIPLWDVFFFFFHPLLSSYRWHILYHKYYMVIYLERWWQKEARYKKSACKCLRKMFLLRQHSCCTGHLFGTAVHRQ